MIWLALDNGISCIHHDSPLRFITSFQKNIGTVFSACLIKDNLYLSTNQGAFIHNLSNLENFKEISGINSQAWDFYHSGEQLLCGHNKGTSEISGTESRRISSVEGGTCFREGIIHNKEVLVQSTYSHLVIFKKGETGKWEYSHVVNGFNNPVRFIEIDALGNIWASHFYKGLYCIKLSQDLKQAERVRSYFTSNENQNREETPLLLFKVRERIVCSDKKKFYAFDSLADTLKPYDIMNTCLPEYAEAYRAIQVSDNKYWLIDKAGFILISFRDKDVKVIRKVPFSLFNETLSYNDANVIPISKNKYVFCLNNGVVIYDSNESPYHDVIKKRLRIEQIETSDKENRKKLLDLSPENIPKIPYGNNNLIFHVTYPDLPDKNITYKFKLEGLENDWSDPSNKPIKKYDNLPSGTYIFHVQALDYEEETLTPDTVSYRFEILPPFYASTAAKFIYAIILLFLLWIGYKIIKRQIILYKEKLREKQLLEQEQMKFKAVQLEKQELETNLSVKGKELAALTMESIKMNQVLTDLKEELKKQKAKMGQQFPNKYYEKMISMVDELLSPKDNWAVFQSNFDLIHESFFRNLHATYPKLTSTDLKLCALLRLNMNSKEIAEILKISLKGVEIARYRLRKKLGLSPDVGLIDFMLSFGSGDEKNILK
jgi:DNA-binding CsgD family transcriptional regulator